MSTQIRNGGTHLGLLLCGNYIAQGQNTTNAPKYGKTFLYHINQLLNSQSKSVCVCVSERRQKTKIDKAQEACTSESVLHALISLILHGSGTGH